jgi:hypothetical protein
LWKSSVAWKVPGEGACFTRAVSGSRFSPVSAVWVSVCVFLFLLVFVCIFQLVFTVYQWVAASNQVFLVLWAEILHLCSLRWPSDLLLAFVRLDSVIGALIVMFSSLVCTPFGELFVWFEWKKKTALFKKKKKKKKEVAKGKI